MKYKNIIFDLDGTLLDTAAGVKEAVIYTVKELGYRDLSEDELDSFIGPPIQNSLISHFGCTKDDAQKGADIFRNYYKDISLLNATPFQGIYELMKYITAHGMNAAVATYKREDYAVKLLKAFHFDDYCSVMHGADNNNEMTKADIIKLCVNELNGFPEESIYIGDTMSDYKGASTCGLSFVGVTYGFGFKPGNKYEFTTVNEPIKLVELL